MEINVFKILNKTEVEGPGKRFCIWVQGCLRKCEGCHAKKTWSHKPNKIMTVDEIFELIKKQKDIEGVTFLGGEPFEQADALGLLAQKVQSLGLSVMTFTGALLEDLKYCNDKGFDLLLAYTDLLVDGHFDSNQFDLSRPWVGSKNQRYHFLTDRYSIDDINKYKNKLEIRIDKNGFLFVNGMADFDKIENDLCLQVPEIKV